MHAGEFAVLAVAGQQAPDHFIVAGEAADELVGRRHLDQLRR